MWFSSRCVPTAVLAALSLLVGLGLGPERAWARPRKSHWMVSFLGGAVSPLGDTADVRDLGLAVGLRAGYTSKLGLGLAVSALYSPLSVDDSSSESSGNREVTDNHFVAAALVPRFTLGRDVVRLSIGAGGGGIMEQTRTKVEIDGVTATEVDSVFAPSAVGEIGLETYLWDSGGLVVTGSYLRSFGDRELEIGAVLGGLIFTFR